MSNEEKIDKWIADHDGEDYCKYCRYDDGCSHGIACYGGAPIEPPCCGCDIKELLDTDAIFEVLETEKN